MIDVNKLLQLDYLKKFNSELDILIKQEENKKIGEFELDVLLSMDRDKIVSIFNEYGIKCENILEKLDSLFLDEKWEFFDLFEDDLEYSMNQRQLLDEKVKIEVLELNKKVEANNERINIAISKLKEKKQLIGLIINFIETSSLIKGEDINELKELILVSQLIKENERLDACLLIVKYLIESGKRIIFNKDNIKTDEFDKSVEEAYESSTYQEQYEDKSISIPYYEVIMKYYNKYKDLIEVAGYVDVFELIESSSNILENIDVDSLSKDDFCLQLGCLLYQLCYIGETNLEKEVLMELSKLDLLYDEDKGNISTKNEMLTLIDGFFSKLEGMDISLLNKIRTRLKVLKSNLKDIISNKRISELVLELNDIKRHIDNLAEILNLIKQVNEYTQKIMDIFNSSKIDSDDSLLLSSLQNKLSEYEFNILSERQFKDVRKELFDCFVKVDEILVRLQKSNVADETKNKILLRGFVLCDCDENNRPYILDDLELSSKNKMIDKSIEPKKLKKGFDAYNKLVNDLFLLGNTEKLDNNDSYGYNIDRLNEAVYWDTKNKTHENETGMYQIKGERNGVERFVEQRIVLHNNTLIHKQVIDIIREILPNVEFDSSGDINIYINYASAMKRDDEHLYNIAINRFTQKSLLYKIFNEPKNKTQLSDNECDLLKDIIHASLDAFSKLDEINSYLHLEVVKQIEEGRTRG